MIDQRHSGGVLQLAKRVLIMQAVARTKTIDEAGHILGMSRESVTRYLKDIGFTRTERPEAAYPDELQRLLEYLVDGNVLGFDPIELGC